MEDRRALPPHLFDDVRGKRGGGNTNSGRTRQFCRLSRAVEFVVELCALWEIGVALAQRRAHTRLGLGRNTHILFQRNGGRGPKRKGDKSA